LVKKNPCLSRAESRRLGGIRRKEKQKAGLNESGPSSEGVDNRGESKGGNNNLSTIIVIPLGLGASASSNAPEAPVINTYESDCLIDRQNLA
jgi:hypothetical protein